IVDQDAIADVHIAGEVLVRDRELGRPRTRVRGEHEVHAVRELEGCLQLADANSWSLQVTEDGDGPPELPGQVTHHLDGGGVLVVRTVREVDAGDVEPRFHQTPQSLGRAARRPKGADDFRAAEWQVAFAECGRLPRGDKIAAERLRFFRQTG